MPYKDKDQQLKYDRERRARLRKLIEEAKSVPCQDCEETFPSVCMDFDHVSGEKVETVARMVRNTWSLSKIEAEIAKCEVVCSNCHRIRTSDRLKARNQEVI